jgi:ATP-dependent Lhr-like helicase
MESITTPNLRQALPKTFYAFFGNFPRLRPAQEQTIPHILSGRNILLISPTGSGKTEAMVAPVSEHALSAPGQLYCLYICPTRALVNDIERRLESPFYKLGMRVGVRHGDRKTLQGKTIPSVLVTTPESLDVMLGSQNNQRDRLQTVQAVIIDEVHQFYQTHRGYQLILLLERLKRLTKSPLQRLLLSATAAQPEKMAAWFQGSDEPFTVVQIPGGRDMQVTLEHLTAASGDEFKQGQAVIDIIRPILQEHRKVLLFANSRNECDWLYWKLHDQLKVETFLHYSTLDKDYRETIERKFQQAQQALCIATSTLELGIDIGNIDAVVMYGAPASISSFAQRVGRGNQRSGTCIVYGLCRDYHINGSDLGAEHDLILLYALVASLLDSELEIKPDAELFSVHVQQFFSLVCQYDSIKLPILKRLIDAAEKNPFATEGELAQVLSNLSLLEFFSHDPQTQTYYPAEKWYGVKSSLQLWGNIPAQFYDTAIDAEKEVPISQLPSGKVKTGQVRLIAGEPRIITQVSGSVVRTLRLAANDPQMIAYETAGAATPPEVTQKARELIQSSTFPDLPVEIEDSLHDVMRSYRQRLRSFDFASCVPFQQVEGGRYCYYTFGGTWANEFLAMVLRKQGMSVEADSWRIYTNQPIQSISELPIEIASLESLVRERMSALIRRIGFSYHFYQLPEELQHREVCSLLGLPRLSDWFREMCNKSLIAL